MNEYIFDKDKLKDGMVFKNILEICDVMGFDKKNVKPNNNKGKAIKRSLDTVCKWHEVKNGRNTDVQETLDEALLNIIRAIKLAEEVPKAKNIKETLLHMVYTKGRILIACCCNSVRYVPRYRVQNHPLRYYICACKTRLVYRASCRMLGRRSADA